MTVVSPNKTDIGFLNHSLALFDTKDFAAGTAPIYSSFENVTTCRYTEYRNPPDHFELPYKRPTIYWHILAARLAFVVVFQVINLFFIIIKHMKYILLTKKNNNSFLECCRVSNNGCAMVPIRNTTKTE